MLHVSVVVLRFRMILTGDGKKQDEIKKLRFTIDALKQPDPFAREQSLTQEVVEAIRWQAARTPLQVMGERERIMSELETEANNCWHVWLRVRVVPLVGMRLSLTGTVANVAVGWPTLPNT